MTKNKLFASFLATTLLSAYGATIPGLADEPAKSDAGQAKEEAGQSASPQVLFGRAERLAKDGEYELAIKKLDQILSGSPKDEQALLLRGRCFANSGSADKAVADFKAAILGNPSLAENFFSAPPNDASKEAKGPNAKAIKAYEDAMHLAYPDGIKPKATKLITISGGNEIPGAGLLEGDAKEQISEYNQSLQGAPTNGEYYYRRGKAYQKLMKVAEALRDFNAAIEKEPQQAKYYIARASLYFQMGKQVLMKQDIAEARNRNASLPSEINFDLPPFPKGSY